MNGDLPFLENGGKLNDDMKLYIQKMVSAKVNVQVQQQLAFKIRELRADLMQELSQAIDAKLESKVQVNKIP